MQVRDVTMDFGYGHAFTEASPEAYERLILDVLLGDPPLFPRHEEVELSWKILDPILAHWAKKGRPEQYGSGTWGPAAASALIGRDGLQWREEALPEDLKLNIAENGLLPLFMAFSWDANRYIDAADMNNKFTIIVATIDHLLGAPKRSAALSRSATILVLQFGYISSQPTDSMTQLQ